jgi:Secretion system C-terminal sorting domain
MKRLFIICSLLISAHAAFTQNVGIVRNNYISSYYDSILMINIEVLDSATIRLGSVDPLTGVVTNVGNTAYNMGINLNGATLNPYLNRYYIGSGFNLLTFDMNLGDIINNVPISGSLPSASFQNYRFNPSDSIIYGMVPNNFYSTYYDSVLMMNIEVLDSTQIRFASIDPTTGQYTLIGNVSHDNIYTLAGNSIDPYQMVYYYSAVTSLIGVDIYTGNTVSNVPILLPPNAIFENITYSCADTAIYGITRQNYISTVYDSLVMGFVDVVDSTTFRLSKINPNTGVVSFISPNNLGVGGNLNGGSFIDPNTMTMFYSNGNQIAGVSLVSGQITSLVTKSFSSGAFALDMMRSTQNCFGAVRIRNNESIGLDELSNAVGGVLYPNPAQNEIAVNSISPIHHIEIVDYRGSILLESSEKTMDISTLSSGIYFAKVYADNGAMFTSKFVKN